MLIIGTILAGWPQDAEFSRRRTRLTTRTSRRRRIFRRRLIGRPCQGREDPDAGKRWYARVKSTGPCSSRVSEWMAGVPAS